MLKSRALACAAAGVVVFTAGSVRAATWVPATGTWGTAGNWTPADVPNTAAETATINAGTATLDGNYTIGTLALAGGAVAGTFTLTTATLGWSAGTMADAGTTTVTGAATLANDGNYIFLQGRTLNLQGATTQSSTNGYYLGVLDGATINNSGTYSFAGDISIVNNGGAASAFNNSGTLRKTGGTGTSSVDFLVNTGTVSVQSGAMQLNLKESATSSGTFASVGGRTMTLVTNGTHAFSSSATFSGTGVRLAGGTFSTSGTVTAAASSAVALTGATLTGTGTWAFSDLSWSTGTMNGSGVTTVTGTATLANDGNYIFLEGRTLNLQGNTTQSSANGYYFGLFDGATINNSGTYSFAGDTSIVNTGGAASAFNNSGTLRKTGGSGTSSVDFVTNTGTVSSQSGTLRLNLKDSATSTGIFNATAGNTLTLTTPGTHTLSAAATFTGVGIVRFNGGTFGVQGTRTIPNAIGIDGSDVNFNGAATAGGLSFAAGVLGGTGTITAASLDWSGGTMNDSGATTVAGAATLTNNVNYLFLGGRTLNLQGNTTQSSSGGYYFGLSDGAIINNSGIYSLADNNSVVNTGGAASAFNNSGALRKTGGAGISYVDFVTNTGTVSSQSGTLQLNLKDTATSTGTFDATAGNVLNLTTSGTHTLSAAASFTGVGTVRFGGGTFNVQGARAIPNAIGIDGSDVNFNGATAVGGLPIASGVLGGGATVTAASLDWSGGTMNDGGTTTVTGAATLANNVNYIFLDGRTLNLQGSTTQSSTGGYYFGLSNGAILNNGGTYSLADNNSVVNTGGAASAFNNSGTLRKTGGGGTSYVDFVTNTGTVSSQSGTLRVALRDAATSSGAFNATAGNTLVLTTGGTHTFSAASSFTGAGIVRLENGTFTTSGTVAAAPAAFVLDGAAMTGTWQLANLTWNNGPMVGAGTTTVTGAATFTNDVNYLTLDGHTLNLQGSTTQSSTGGYYFGLSNGAVLTNSGTYSFADNSSIIFTGGTPTAFNNSGTLRKTGGSGISYVDFVVNTGTVSAQSGTLQLNLKDAAASTGVFNAAAGTTLNMTSNGTHTLTPAATLTGSGTIRVTGGTVDLQGSRTLAMPIAVAGGTLRIGAATDTFASLTFSDAGRFDVGTGMVIVNNGGGAANLADTRDLVNRGSVLNQGGYFTSSADADHRIGYGDTGTAIKVRYTLNGDADLDGGVSINDFNALAGNFGKGTGQVWAGGDFDYDGGVSINDFNLLAGQFGRSLTSPGASADLATLLAFAAANNDLAAFEAVTGVPEPGAITLLAVGAGLSRRRRTSRS